MNEQQADLYRRIEEFPLDQPGAAFPFAARLARENGWSRDYANCVVGEYKRFALLAVAAGHSVTPSDQVDQAWHLHLTFTQSYWTRFCPEVLGKPLHHNPTQGGAAEQTKFNDWYNRTLESYEHFFGHAPPVDIWPDAATRFGSDINHRRVNASRNWIVPKWPLKWSAGIAVLVLLTVCAVTGCSTAQRGDGLPAFGLAASMSGNPFDLHGEEFPGLFVLAFACLVAVAAILRCLIRRTDSVAPHGSPELDHYETAYLAGGEQGAVHAVLAGMVNCEVLTFDVAKRRLIRTKKVSGSNSLHPSERAVLETIDEQGASLDELGQMGWLWPSKIAERLKSLDLIVSDERDSIGRIVPTMLVLLVPAMGAIKILVGLSREKPVGLLAIACIVATIVAFAGFGCRLHRTWRGDRALGRLKSDHAALQHDFNAVATFDVPLAVGLFGIGVLAGGPLDEFQTALILKAESGGSGGCGGGGCGGGCGGCGGCG